MSKQAYFSKGGIVLLFVILIIILLIWGFIGGAQASSVGVTCDMGVGKNLCWIWHKNAIGQIAEGINKLLGK